GHHQAPADLAPVALHPDESRENGIGHFPGGRLLEGLAAERKEPAEAAHVGPLDARRQADVVCTLRSDDTEAIGSGNRSPSDGDKHTDSHRPARLLPGCFGRSYRSAQQPASVSPWVVWTGWSA